MTHPSPPWEKGRTAAGVFFSPGGPGLRPPKGYGRSAPTACYSPHAGERVPIWPMPHAWKQRSPPSSPPRKRGATSAKWIPAVAACRPKALGPVDGWMATFPQSYNCLNSEVQVATRRSPPLEFPESLPPNLFPTGSAVPELKWRSKEFRGISPCFFPARGQSKTSNPRVHVVMIVCASIA